MEKEKIDIKKAIAMLPSSERVHTFRNSSMMLIGADWDKSDIIKAMEKYGVELSGEQAKSMNHGLVLNDGTYLFIETNTPKDT